MKKKKIIWFAVMVFFVSTLIFGINYFISVKQYKDTVNNMTFETIDVSKIPNGVYVGECDVNFIYAKVMVTIKDGEIENIDLVEHKNDRGEQAEMITKKIIEIQSLKVDAISGATNSSKVIKKAVENALQSPI